MNNLREAHESVSYNDIFEGSADALILLDKERFFDCNPAALKLFGYRSVEELNTKHPSEVSPSLQPNGESSLELANKKIEEAYKKGVNLFEWVHKRKNGEEFPASVLLVPFKLGNRRVLQATVRDISKEKKAIVSLKESEYFFRESQKAANIGSYKFDFKTSTWVGSSVMDKIFGIKADYNKTIENWLKIVHPDDREIMRHYFVDEVIAKRINFNKEYRILRINDGELRWLLGLGKVLFSTNGEPISMVGTIMDITERKLAQLKAMELMNRNEAIIQSIGDAVIACDKTGKVNVFNKVAELMTGISAKEAIGKHYSEVVNCTREDDGEKCNDFIAEAILHKKITEMSNHVLLVRKDGVKVPVSDSAAPITDHEGNILGCVVIFHDMSRERKIDKAKTEFVSLASHQLRTPLSTINWYLEILINEEIGELNPKQQTYAKEIYGASQRMVLLINSLLNVSRLELGTFGIEPKRVSIVSVAKKCIKELKPLTMLKDIKIIEKYQDESMIVKIDPKLVTIIMENLLTNSIKYSHKAGQVRLSIKLINKDLIIQVSDHGIGIPISQQKEIFGKMFRADNAKTMDPDGSGLGLYIVKQVLSYVDGSINFESKENVETKFVVIIPLQKNISKKHNNRLL